MKPTTENAPLYHRDAGSLREDLEKVQRILRVCVDSLMLASIPDIIHTTETLNDLAEQVWEMIQPAKDLENTLFVEWSEKLQAERVAKSAAQQKQWRENLPPGAVEAFQQVNAIYDASNPNGGNKV